MKTLSRYSELAKAFTYALNQWPALTYYADDGWAEASRVEMWRGGFSSGISVKPPLSIGGALLSQTWLRFHIPLIEPDLQISRIRLSDRIIPSPTESSLVALSTRQVPVACRNIAQGIVCIPLPVVCVSL